jgi:hypothetical protein
MKKLRWSAFAIGLVLLMAVASGCAVTTGGYGYDAQYYQPAGYNYGGWGPTYVVAPVRVEGRGDDHRDERHDEHGGGRPVPSIPSNSHARDSHEH